MSPMLGRFCHDRMPSLRTWKSQYPTTMHDVPDARAILPRSDAFSSHMEITVPNHHARCPRCSGDSATIGCLLFAHGNHSTQPPCTMSPMLGRFCHDRMPSLRTWKSQYPTTMHDVPDARAILPRSDAFSSHME